MKFMVKCMYRCTYCSYIVRCYSKYSVVDGGWSRWKLAPCSKSCGGGKRNYIRACSNPIPLCGGKMCEGIKVFIPKKKCNDFCCPGTYICKITVSSYDKY